jgi:uncharacterized protein YbjT (DUF2867 family)
MKKVLVAGATGYLGRYLIKVLKKENYWIRALTRNRTKLDDLKHHIDEIFEAEVTKPVTLNNICNDIDVVISSVGITRQKDGFTYMDVDYQANVNLLQEAMKSKAEKFIYISVLNGTDLTELKMVEAKERFVEELKSSGIEYGVIRPNGFFSDMKEVLDMAKKGKVYLFGDGEYKGNPIHGGDLAEFIVNHLDRDEKEMNVGGPDLLTQNQIAQIAFEAVGKKERIIHIPTWIRDVSLAIVRIFTSQKIFGPIEFFMTVMTRDMIAPTVGNHHLSDYYNEISRSDK